MGPSPAKQKAPLWRNQMVRFNLHLENKLYVGLKEQSIKQQVSVTQLINNYVELGLYNDELERKANEEDDGSDRLHCRPNGEKGQNL